MIAASFYQRKEVSDDLGRILGTPEFRGFVVVDVSPRTDKAERGPKRETVHIRSTVRPTASLPLRRIALGFRLNWQTITYAVSAALVTVAGILMLLGFWLGNEALTAWGVLLIGAAVAGWTTWLILYVIFVLADVIRIGWFSLHPRKHLEEDID